MHTRIASDTLVPAWSDPRRGLTARCRTQAQAAELLAQHRADKLPPLGGHAATSDVGNVMVGPQWLWRQDRVPLCTPMLTMSVDDKGNK